MKSKTKPDKYEYAAVCLPREVKRKVRHIAAEMETSIGRASRQLIELGLDEYNRQQATAKAESAEAGA